MRHKIYWTPQKLQRRLDLIQQLDYRRRQPLTPFQYTELDSPAAAPPLVADGHDWETIPYKTYWGRWRTDFALRTAFTIPTDWTAEAAVALYLPLGDAGDFSHPEALAYVDGQALASCDRHHHEIMLPQNLRGGQEHQLLLHGWTGLGDWDRGERATRLFMQECFVVQIDQPTRDFLALARVALEVAEQLDGDSRSKQLLYTALDAAFRILDTRDPLGTDAFYASVPAALQALRQGLAEAGSASDINIVAAGHAHIDVAWLWTLAQTRRKAERTFHNALHLMAQYPEYHFSQSQPQLYRYVEEDSPALFERIKTQIAEGRWEPMGGMWVEPDCNVTGPESLVRQLLLGRSYFREHFGAVDTPVLWLPDTFGFSWALPQLMAQADIQYFITSKLSWNQYNEIPHQLMWWQGLDGTKILTHFIATKADWRQDLYPHATTYNGKLNAREVFETWRNFSQKDAHDELLTAFGYGDGGGGPTREMLENLQQLDALPGAPRVRGGTVRDFMDGVAARAENLPTWSDEFYFELHRGTLTSQARNKWHNRKSEFLLHDAEFLAAYAALATDYAYPHAAFTEAWELVCLNQFHDILPGTSITEVYEDSTRDYARVRSLAEIARDEAIASLAQTLHADADFVAINPTSFGAYRIGFLEAEVDGLELTDGEATIITQPVADGTLVALPYSMPYSLTALKRASASTVSDQLSIQQDADTIILENDLLRATLNAMGELSSVYDKDARREVLAPEQTGNQLIAFEDRPLEWDAWDVDIYHEDRSEIIRDVQQMTIIETGPVRVGVEIVRHYRSSTITQRIYLTCDGKRLDFETEIDWQEQHTLLKAAFPVDIHSPRATYDIQWGNIERPTHRNTSWDWAKFEVAAQKWADLSEGNYGVALLNDSKYAYDVRDNVMRISLLKSATWPDEQADQGQHRMTYSLLPHRGDWRNGVAEEAYALNDPIILRSVSGGAGTISSAPLVDVAAHNVAIETIKQAEDGNGIIVRLYEYQRERGPVTLHTNFKVSAVFVCNLLEENTEELDLSDGKITLMLRPYQIVSLRLIP